MRKLGIAALVVVLVAAAAIALSVVAASVLAPNVDASSPINQVDARTPQAAKTPLATKTPLAMKTPAATATTPDKQAWLGITVADVNAQTAQKYSLSQQTGVVITAVTTDSPAAVAGLKEGDLVDKVNGVAVSTAQDVVTQVRKAKPGDTVTLSITRDGKAQDIKAKAGQAPSAQPSQTPLSQRTMPGGRGQILPQASPTPGATQNQAWLGIAVANIDTQTAQQFKLDQETGVVIVSVTADSPAAKAGLAEGDVVTKVNGVAVTTSQDVVTQVRKATAGDVVTLDIVRAGKAQAIKVTSGQAPAPQPSQTPSVPRFRSGGNDKSLPTPTPQPGTEQQRLLPGDLLQNLAPEMKALLDVSTADQFSRYLGATLTVKDKDGKAVTVYMIPGTVKDVSASSITITPNNPESKGGPYTIDDTTTILAGMVKGNEGALKVDDRVVLVVVGDSTHAAVIAKVGLLSNLGKFMMPGTRGMMPFGNGDGSLQLPDDFFQNPQKYLDMFRGMFGGLVPVVPEQPVAPGGGA